MSEVSTRANELRKKQFLILGLISIALLVVSLVLGLFMSPTKPVGPAQPAATKTIAVNVTGTDRERWRIDSAAEMRKLQEDLTQLQRQIEDQKRVQVEEKKRADEEIKRKAEAPPPLPAPATAVPPPSPPGGLTNSLFAPGGLVPAPPAPVGAIPGPTQNQPDSTTAINHVILGKKEPEPLKDEQAPSTNSIVASGEKFGEKTGKLLRGPKDRYADDDPQQVNRAFGRKVETYLPPGTFMRALILNGLDAPTGGTAQNNPHPVLLRVIDDAQLPNGFRARVKECLITANGFGDLSSERAMIRVDRMSCVDETGGVVDVAVKGYVSGEDGKTGVRGRLISKTGQVLANALWAGIGSAVGSVLKADNTAIATNALGTTTETPTDATKAAIGAGVGKAFDELAKYYVRLADKMYPVIEVDGGRPVDVVITRGLTIERR